MTAAVVIALAAVLLAAARWGLNRRHTAQGVYPPEGLTEDALLADADRALSRARDLGASTGHLWAWRDLLSDTAARMSEAAAEDGAPERLDGLRRDLDAAEGRIRAALADLDPPRAEGPAPSGTDSGGRNPWSG
ncbi:hypothetical protein [Nocardiopsis dassonvillei]|uniref:hypothetical protein n=1 Tax=Nocardiopsis dassonvillei TaxID=2014 RepID=UPI00366E5F1D